MIIKMVDRDGRNRAKDIMDINLDMSIVDFNGNYKIKLNNTYYLDEVFKSKKQAKEAFDNIVDMRNDAEAELHLYS